MRGDTALELDISATAHWPMGFIMGWFLSSGLSPHPGVLLLFFRHKLEMPEVDISHT